MNCRVLNEEFKPIKIEIEITSIEEMKELWCRLNINNKVICKINKKYSYSNYGGNNNTFDLFNLIDNELERLIK